MDPFIGEIRMVGFNYAPQGWALCNGQSLPIAQYQALFVLLGTTFGGNGTTNFNLPDLQGRVPINVGNGAGLPAYTWGQKGGAPNVTLQAANLPAHTHMITPPVSNAHGTTSTPVNTYPAVDVTTITGGQRGETAATTSHAASSVPGQSAASYPSGPAGSNIPAAIQPPFLAVYFIIALQGIFPSRS